MSKTIIVLPKKYKICIDGKIKTFLIAFLRKESNTERIKLKIAKCYRNTLLSELIEFKSLNLAFKEQIFALGSKGPFPYQGSPALTTDGMITSIGLPGLKWSKGTRILVVKL